MEVEASSTELWFVEKETKNAVGIITEPYNTRYEAAQQTRRGKSQEV